MFVVLIAKAVPPHLHGYISRFLIEVNAGVYVGKITSRVADAIWERCSTEEREGALTMVRSDNEFEQGFSVKTCNSRKRILKCMDGMWLEKIILENSDNTL